jgi:general secretion pathway protein H
MSEEERVISQEKASSLPSGVSIIDVWLKGKGKKMAGETGIRFTKKGYVQQSAIHLGSEDGRRFTLVLSPFLGRVQVLENYVEFEDV